MTKEQFDAKFELLINDVDFLGFVRKQAKFILSSGAIDLESYGDDYRLPKMVLCVALKEASLQYEPLNDKDKKTVKNLGRF